MRATWQPCARASDAFQTLIEQHKLVSAAAIPLRKESVDPDALRIEFAALAGVDSTPDPTSRCAVSGAAGDSIRAADGDFRRGLDMAADRLPLRAGYAPALPIFAVRRFVLTMVVMFVFLFNFASQIGALATVMGFAAAGIAVALQNVILSLAGYFFLIGKFGIKVGDRVAGLGRDRRRHRPRAGEALADGTRR